MTPTTELEIARILVDAGNVGSNVVPVGGGLSLPGSIDSESTIRLRTDAFRTVEGYQPSDLTLKVGAGTTFASLAGVLAEHNQEVPIDVPHPHRATVGGLVATGFAGPRRLGHGTLKDLLIGCAFVQGNGLIAKAGGMVVKNVSGFEIPRLMHGSWGTLAVITSVNLKVLPKPRTEGTLVVRLERTSLSEAVTMCRHLAAPAAPISAMTIEQGGESLEIAVRIMGRSRAVNAQIADLKASLATDYEATVQEAEESAAFWQSLVDRWDVPETGIQVSIGVPPRQVNALAERLKKTMAGASDQTSYLVQPGAGSIRLRNARGMDESSASWEGLGSGIHALGGVMVVERAPTGWAPTVDRWGFETPARDLMRSVKRQFDPGRTLNKHGMFI